MNRIYPSELKLNKVNASDTQNYFFFTVYIYIFQKDLFHPKFIISAMICKVSFFGWWRSPFYLLRGIYIFSLFDLLHVVKVSSHVADFNARNIISNANLLQEGYRVQTFTKLFQILSPTINIGFDIQVGKLPLQKQRARFGHSKTCLSTPSPSLPVI